MMPCSWAASSASAICFAIGSASSMGIGPCLIRCERRPFDQLHHEGAVVAALFETVNGARCSDGSGLRASSLRGRTALGARHRQRPPRAEP